MKNLILIFVLFTSFNAFSQDPMKDVDPDMLYSKSQMRMICGELVQNIEGHVTERLYYPFEEKYRPVVGSWAYLMKVDMFTDMATIKTMLSMNWERDIIYVPMDDGGDLVFDKKNDMILGYIVQQNSKILLTLIHK